MTELTPPQEEYISCWRSQSCKQGSFRPNSSPFLFSLETLTPLDVRSHYSTTIRGRKACTATHGLPWDNTGNVSGDAGGQVPDKGKTIMA